eukprot:TRINITY_DN81034_c0_g1_i1.p1 TRINITY_DN81034_c0_g1~~TRINITY_DN81034_c0_g1_i1.p1  ORF type:complete len:474 (-),score=115.71 TRINITY_DN81034_c0_g1_i1:90-1511(-)
MDEQFDAEAHQRTLLQRVQVLQPERRKKKKRDWIGILVKPRSDDIEGEERYFELQHNPNMTISELKERMAPLAQMEPENQFLKMNDFELNVGLVTLKQMNIEMGVILELGHMDDHQADLEKIRRENIVNEMQARSDFPPYLDEIMVEFQRESEILATIFMQTNKNRHNHAVKTSLLQAMAGEVGQIAMTDLGWEIFKSMSFVDAYKVIDSNLVSTISFEDFSNFCLDVKRMSINTHGQPYLLNKNGDKEEHVWDNDTNDALTSNLSTGIQPGGTLSPKSHKHMRMKTFQQKSRLKIREQSRRRPKTAQGRRTSGYNDATTNKATLQVIQNPEDTISYYSEERWPKKWRQFSEAWAMEAMGNTDSAMPIYESLHNDHPKDKDIQIRLAATLEADALRTVQKGTVFNWNEFPSLSERVQQWSRQVELKMANVAPGVRSASDHKGELSTAEALKPSCVNIRGAMEDMLQPDKEFFP